MQRPARESTQQQRETNLYSTDDRRWQAVLAHDAAAEGKFVYAVKTTGVYCWTTCYSRRPLRHNVEFFTMAAEAEQAGFRPCKRCKPQFAGGGTCDAERRAAAQVAELCRAIEANPDGIPKLRELAVQAGTSPHAVLRAFRKITGITPRKYADAVRLRRLKQGLKKGSDVTTAMYDAGYGSPSRLYESAAASLGMTPGTYRKGGEGMQIAYTIENSNLGKILVGATLQGVSAIYLGDKEQPLERELRAEYPKAEIHRDAGRLKTYVGQILNHVRGNQRELNLPLDVQATAFQRRVWEELRRIPYGATRSYSDVATAIGRPRAVRAVANACATNPVCITVPCHRVIGKNGKAAGYRWGIERKNALLARESQNKPKRKPARA
jgi:AraC family transcriptional regulator, regulatory protein of adaptative response / methylated-DNA-[protein]-cysteine methyltransferase